MRKPTKILLVLLGATTIAGCDSPQKRNVYANREDCVADYSDAQCTSAGATAQNVNSNGGGPYYGGGHYFGPWYSSYSGGSVGAGGADPGPGRGGRAVSSISRGGFGASARFFGAGS